jgi:hypothetical protein
VTAGVAGVDATERISGVEPGDLERGTETSSPHMKGPQESAMNEETDRG